MEQMTEQIKSIIQTLNSSQVRSLVNHLLLPEAAFVDDMFDCFLCEGWRT